MLRRTTKTTLCHKRIYKTRDVKARGRLESKNKNLGQPKGVDNFMVSQNSQGPFPHGNSDT